MDYWKSHYGIRPEICQYIYNGIDTDYFKNGNSLRDNLKIRSSLGIKESDICLCTCASLRAEKRHVDLIDAAKILIKKGHSIKLLLVGDGVERKNIEMHAKRLDVVNTLVITGFQKDVRPYILASDVVIMPSSAVETFSIAILEAMALGKPIVSSNIGGASEQVSDGVNGFLFPAGNINALAEKIKFIIEKNLFQSMGRESRSLVVEKFTSQQMVENYQKLLLSL
jgi:Glycosyltransferase